MCMSLPALDKVCWRVVRTWWAIVGGIKVWNLPWHAAQMERSKVVQDGWSVHSLSQSHITHVAVASGS